MKTLLLLTSTLLGTVLLFSACAQAPASQTESSEAVVPPLSSSTTDLVPSEPEAEVPSAESLVYRGEVTQVGENEITVTQLEGYDYGQPSILFHIDENTFLDENGVALAQEAFVAVRYDGRLTRSMPPQATAQSIEVIAPYSEGILQNGTIQQVEETEDGWNIDLLPFGAPEAENTEDRSNLVVLNVPQNALENLTAEDLTPGAEVSAVTRGIAATSLPPQMPVNTLLPFSG
ncbi:YobA family protein [Ruminococcaceae bacterium OttesenSCG-928-I18]|nr:YobA family protein [Ruminococcaceae bacterium OttesenSCG-928-I18]